MKSYKQSDDKSKPQRKCKFMKLSKHRKIFYVNKTNFSEFFGLCEN